MNVCRYGGMERMSIPADMVERVRHLTSTAM